MNKTKQLIAIAKVCGWTEFEDCTCGFHPRAFAPIKGNHKKHLPFYIDDLNAMHEAIHAKIDVIGATSFFYDELESIIGRDLGFNIKVKDNLGFSGHIAHATAPQLCEAFLKTLGLWEDEE